MASRTRALAAVALVLVAYIAVSAQPGSADTNSPYWTCRGSVGYLAGGGTRIEPIVANGTDKTGICANDDDGVNQQIAGSPGSITFQAVHAATAINPTVSSSDLQKATAGAEAKGVRIENADKSFVLTADVAQAGVSAACNGGVPAAGDGGVVTNVSINGSSVSPDKAYEQTGNELNGSPFGQVTKVFFNELTAAGSSTSQDQSVTRRAIHAQIFDGNGKLIFEAVVSEAIAGRHGPVCQKGPRCPDGAVYDQQRGVCVIRETVTGPCPPDAKQEGNVCVRTVTVGTPEGQSKGGTVKPLGEVLGERLTSPCKNKRFGRQVGIVGTEHGDRITGSNKSDRIFVFGGNDRVSGGRGNDCIEGGAGSDQLDGSTGSDWLIGGTGNDQLSGGQRNDWIYGGPGNDKLIGGTGNDRLFGGMGINKLDGGKGNDLMIGGPSPDYIVGGNGRDVIRAGAGNDDINVATAGARAKVDCGPGIDTIRINHNEMHGIKHCEHVLVTTRLTRYRQYNQKGDKKKK